MTTSVLIKAQVHDQKKVVHVKVNDQLHTILKPGEQTEQHVYSGQTITLLEADAEEDTTAIGTTDNLQDDDHNYQAVENSASDTASAAD
mgnify:CR=1 FL=1